MAEFDFLGLRDKTVLVAGIANRRSVATHVAKLLQRAGARVVAAVRDEGTRSVAVKLLGPETSVVVCDVEREESVAALGETLAAQHAPLAGFVHSIAFANYSDGLVPFHKVKREDFLQAVNVSCYSLIGMSDALRPALADDASVVTIGISTTTMAAENYGYMAPVKAALDSAVVFLAKSFSTFSRVRFNAVCPGLLKTSASAGIPGYLQSYLYAEKATLRKQAVSTDEVANAVAFLLSPRSSGINAQRLIIDAGMSTNYFDKEIIEPVVKPKDQ